MNLLQIIAAQESDSKELLFAFSACLNTRDDLDEDEKDAIFNQFCDAMKEGDTPEDD